MSLRRTAVIIICVTFSALFIVLYAISHGNMEAGFNILEREEVEEEVTRGVKAVEGELRELEGTAADWGYWDDTYRFVVGNNADYPRSNVTVESLQAIHVGLLLFYDAVGKPVYGRVLDPATDTLVESPEALVRAVAQSRLAPEGGNTDRQRSGLLVVSGQAWLLASCPILTSTRQGPLHGMLVMGRRLDKANISRLSDRIMLDLAMANLQAPHLSRQVTDAAAALARGKRFLLVPDGAERVTGYALLRDLADKPALLLSVTLPRRIFIQGRLTQRNNIIFLLVIGMTFGLAMMYLVEQRILSRIMSLSRQIGELGAEPGTTRRTSVPGSDEISGLSKAVNAMLDALDHARTRYEMATRAAKVGVWEFRCDTGAYYIDPSFRELLGQGEGQGLGGLEAWLSRVHPDDREAAWVGMGACIEGRRDAYEGEQRMTAGDGSLRWILVRGRTVRDAAGMAARFVGTNTDVTELKRAEESIRELSGALIAAQENERARIARDLHDNVAQDLSAAKIAGQTLLDGVAAPPETVRQRLPGLLALLSRAIGSVRGISYDLRPPDLDYLGLDQALERLCEDFSKNSGIQATFASSGLDGVCVSQEVAINLYRVVQEALANVRRHAEARQVTVRLVESFPKLILRIKDDGRGFVVPSRLDEARRQRRMGLASMRERVALFQGALRVESEPGKGCLVVAEVVYAGGRCHGDETDRDR